MERMILLLWLGGTVVWLVSTSTLLIRGLKGMSGQPPPRPAPLQQPSTTAQPWAPVDVRPDVGPAEVAPPYRRLECLHHPDRGSDRYLEDCDLFDPRAEAHLRFLRWLHETGRVVP